MVIIGKKGRTEINEALDVFENFCPKCGKGDVALTDMRLWFVLLDMPIFPIRQLESFYQCQDCGASFKQGAMDALVGASSQLDALTDAEELFPVTIAACMMHMAKVDGDVADDEVQYIQDAMAKHSAHKAAIAQTLKTVREMEHSDAYVYSLLRKAKQLLTTDAILEVISQAAQVLLADGKIEKAEEQLMKDYLEICGLPPSLYANVQDKIDAAKKMAS